MNRRASLAVLIVCTALLLGACTDARAAFPGESEDRPARLAPAVAPATARPEAPTAAAPTAGPKATNRPKRDERTQPAAGGSAQTPAPFLAPEILGRPTDQSTTLNILPAEPLDVYVEYGVTAGVYPDRTPAAFAAGGQPSEITVDGLPAGTRIYYRIRYREPGATGFATGEEGSFYTQRAPGSTFTFDIQGDSHPERVNKQFDAELYSRTLANAADDRPDFYFTIGDDFSVDTLKVVNAEMVAQVYARQRQWLGQVGAPVFLVNGNHEQAALANLNGTPDNVAVWAQTARNSYYPQPAPDGFYTGDSEPVEHIGLLRDYYAFTWGDALFVVIDPYWHSPEPVDNVFDANRDQKAGRDLWKVTLGEAQYQWIRQTLESSAARYKFVFAHHVNGTDRGAVELAGTYEWGDIAGFPTHRPGWEQPIHQLMANNGVTIFFQGHDHIFAKQELDGVVYQTLPEPANPFYTLENTDAYKSGDKLPNSGHLRVKVSPEQVTVDYIHAFLPADEKEGHRNGEVAYSYTARAHAQPPRTVTLLPLVSTSTANGKPTSSLFPGSVVLGSPTGSSVIASLLADVDLEAYVEYGTTPGLYTGRTAPIALAAGDPAEIVISSLAPDKPYVYRVRFRVPGANDFSAGRESGFHTQRALGSTYTFTLDADPHNRDPNFNADVYGVTMRGVLADKPDFHIDLGDTFMTEKLAPATYEQAVPTYREMRTFFRMLEGSAPLFLVNGNHDGEWNPDPGGKIGDLAMWATRARQEFYPGPEPGAFYSGSADNEGPLGVRDSYYAWTWGDALFVVLDPYWYSVKQPRATASNWDLTLGEAQYEWLKRTLATSDARFKFVFAHNLVGGADQNMRGGIEAAGLYEWGGSNADGSWGFSSERPGWSAPVHRLLVENGVTIFFHGHDHLFVKQELDGVVYQECPQPSYAIYDRTGSAAGYGYTHGDVLGGSGYLRVTVSPAEVKVEYVRSYLPADENAERRSGQVSYAYSVTAPAVLP